MELKKYIITALANPLASIYMLFHRLRRISKLEYLFFNGYSLYPDFITILITKRCNFNCSICASGNPQYTKKHQGEELSTDELKGIIDQVAGWKPAIYINGGEPFLRKDLFELIAYCKKKGLITAVTTNGSFLNLDNVSNIIDSRLDFFSVSIDGPQASHDNKRGFKGAFRKAVDGLRLLVKLRKYLPHIRIASILDYEHIENSRYVLDLAKDIGVDEIAFGNLMFYTQDALNEHMLFIEQEHFDNREILGYEFKENFPDIKESVKNFSENARKEEGINVVFVPDNIQNIARDYYSLEKPAVTSKCFTPLYSVVILPDGKVTPCQEFVVGDLRKAPFKEIWNCEKMRRFRRMRKFRAIPACFRCGEGQLIKFTDEQKT